MMRRVIAAPVVLAGCVAFVALSVPMALGWVLFQGPRYVAEALCEYVMVPISRWYRRG